jgi:RHS repeat-associated protein
VQQGGNTEKSPYLFTSKELDEETGLYYFGARYYDPRTSVWQSADPILDQYLDGKRGMGGVFTSMNLGLYSYVHLNPLAFLDPDGNAPDVGMLWSNYDGDGQGIIEQYGGGLTQFSGQNTCAIRLSNTFNQSGENIPHPRDLPANIRAVTTEKGGNFIFGSRDMGRYLEKELGKPSITTDVITSDNYKEVASQLSGKQGLIQLIAGDPKEYGASGHVDLIGQQGPDTELKGSGVSLGTYFWKNSDAKLTARFWPLEGSVPDQRGVLEKAYDAVFE